MVSVTPFAALTAEATPGIATNALLAPFINELPIDAKILLRVDSTLSGPYFSHIYLDKFSAKDSSNGWNSFKNSGFLICILILLIKSGIV